MQAIDGIKVAANAAVDRAYDGAGLERLLGRTDATIKELEAQNEGGDDPPPQWLPEELHHAQALRERVRLAMEGLTRQRLKRVNLTDEDAQLMKGRQGIMSAPWQCRTGHRGPLSILECLMVDAAKVLIYFAQGRESWGKDAEAPADDE